ncbi:hypothetical protein HBI06_211930 [Parastagonospora nodorum]|nr:hypothetical protein HBI06_211930 [Parastagonospora nodorum]KAH4229897.1 hypothetical protein HBI05_192330 [Parastagonospora nodorum]KAH5108502.1 hypothetical protein HBH71_183560 [Parastagonospora nodorum]
MKHSSRASASKPLTNPTSTKATLWVYTEIGLCVLMHLLNDHPKHIRYRENHKARASGLTEKSRKPESRHSHPSSHPPRIQRDYQPREHERDERPRCEASPLRTQRDYHFREYKREEYQPRHEAHPSPPRRAAQPYQYRPHTPPLPRRPSYSSPPARPGPPPLTHHARPPTPSLPHRPSYSEPPPRLFTRPSSTPRSRPPTPPLPRCQPYFRPPTPPPPHHPSYPRPLTHPFPYYHSPLPRHPGAAPPSPPSRQAQNHPSRHQAWTRIRSVTPSKYRIFLQSRSTN